MNGFLVSPLHVCGCSSFTSVAVIGHPAQKQYEERFPLTHNSRLQLITVGQARQELEASGDITAQVKSRARNEYIQRLGSLSPPYTV